MRSFTTSMFLAGLACVALAGCAASRPTTRCNGQGPGAAINGAQCTGNGAGQANRGVRCANGDGKANCGTCCGGANCTVPAGDATAVSQATGDALRATLEDELTARAFYDAVLKKHGKVVPFSNIIRAEERHASMLRALMERHKVDSSGVVARALPPVPATVAECCRLSAQLERDNVALYDRFMKDASAPDIKAAFERLRSASLNNHLPAFERFAGA